MRAPRSRLAPFGLAAALAVLPGLVPAVAPRGHACSYAPYPTVGALPGCIQYAGQPTLPETLPGNTVFHEAPTIDGVPLPLAADGTIAGWADLPAPRIITTPCGSPTLSLETDEFPPDAPAVAAAHNHRATEPSGLDCRGTPKCGGDVDSWAVEVLAGHDQLTPPENLTYLVFTGDDPATVGGPDDTPVAETLVSNGIIQGGGLLDAYVALRVMDFAGHVSARSNVFRVNR